MTPLEHLQKRLEDTNALIVQFENALTLPENTPFRGSLTANLKSLHNARERLEAGFLEFAALQQQEVYRYRILDSAEPPTLGGIANAWGKFQNVFAVVYSKLRRDKRAMPPALGYSYCFSGSVGVVVTLPRLSSQEAGLLTADPISDASEIVFDLIESKHVTDIAKNLGPEPIKAMNEWLAVHLEHRYGLGLEWKSERETKRIVTVNYDDLVALQTVIENTTAETTLVLNGEIRIVNTVDNIFQINTDDGEIIQGTFTDAITPDHAASVPARYRATIIKTTQIIPKTKKDESREKVTYFLESLEPLTMQKEPPNKN